MSFWLGLATGSLISFVITGVFVSSWWRREVDRATADAHAMANAIEEVLRADVEPILKGFDLALEVYADRSPEDSLLDLQRAIVERYHSSDTDPPRT